MEDAMHLRSLLATAVLLGCLVEAGAQTASVNAGDGPRFRFTEKPGPHPVGLKVVEQYDYSRTYRPITDELGKPFVGDRARPLQTLVWYPSQRSSEKPMTVGDYSRLAATATDFGTSDT